MILTHLIQFFFKGASSLLSIPCNFDQLTLLSDAPLDNTILLAENIENTTLLNNNIDNITLLSDAPFGNTTLLTDIFDSTTEICRA